MHQVIRAIRVHLDLFEDDALFLFDIVLAKGRIEDQIAQDVHGERQVFIEHLGVEADQFLGGEGVEIAADGIDRARDLFGGTRGGPLEEHVLDEVGDAVLFRRFAAGTGAHPDSYRNGTHMVHCLSDDFDAVRQGGHLNVAFRTVAGRCRARNLVDVVK